MENVCRRRGIKRSQTKANNPSLKKKPTRKQNK
jgi:hypothetical protein